MLHTYFHTPVLQNARIAIKIANQHRKVINLVETKNKSAKFIWKKKLIIINSTLNIYSEEFEYVLNDEGRDINLYENAFIL